MYADQVEIIYIPGVGAPSPKELAELVNVRLRLSSARAFLFWDPGLGAPDLPDPDDFLGGTRDLLHAGLCLGTEGQPGALDRVAPAWMLNRDPPADLEASSWRVSLRACLVKTDVLRKIGFIRPGFGSLEAAALEWGHRCITRGVVCRHAPQLIANCSADGIESPLPPEDELRFTLYRFGRRWLNWAVFRTVISEPTSLPGYIRGWMRLSTAAIPPEPAPYRAGQEGTPAGKFEDVRVSVLIPTLDRYAYLETLLEQFRDQTVAPFEIIIVDQTQIDRRRKGIYDAFPDLPLVVIYLDAAGQCSARNAGLAAAKGDTILFVDDDDEIDPGLIAAHLRNLDEFQAEVSSGVADEVGAGPLPEDFTYIRVSNVFPTNNSMARRSVFGRSGLFDLAYNHGQRADGDLGMRMYLDGALMVLNPAISVLHHHAPRGGLRTHKARVVTYASSRQKLLHRHLPSVSDFYLSRRYFSDRQRREMKWLSLLGTFQVRGGFFRKALKAVIALFLLPDTLLRIRARDHEASKMLESYPQIPEMPEQHT